MEPIEARLQEEYALETQRTLSLLGKTGVDEDDLSKTGLMSLHVLAEVAELLQLKDTRTSSYVAATLDLVHEFDDAEEAERELQQEVAATNKAAEELNTECKDLERVKQQLEAAAAERENHENTTTMAQRTAEYIERERNYDAELQSLETALRDLKFTDLRPRIEHHKLAAVEQECEQIEAGNADLRRQLGAFHGLPLHKELAAATLRQAQQDLAQLEDEFNRHIRAMV